MTETELLDAIWAIPGASEVGCLTFITLQDKGYCAFVHRRPGASGASLQRRDRETYVEGELDYPNIPPVFDTRVEALQALLYSFQPHEFPQFKPSKEANEQHHHHRRAPGHGDDATS